MGCWGITAFESDAGLDAVGALRKNLPKDGKLELEKLIDAMKQIDWCVPDEATPEWNKHMVKRVLENRKYAGLGDYPAILPENLWHKAQAVRIKKTADWISQSECIEMVKRRFTCGECGSAISKDTSARDGIRWWHCTGPECTAILKMRDKALEETVIALLNRLITSPELLDPLEPSEPLLTLEAERMQNEINRELNKADINEEYLTALIFGCAAEKYAMLDDGAELRKIAGLKAELNSRPLLTAFDPALFGDVTQSLLVMDDGSLALQITGGNIISETGKEHIRNADDNRTDYHGDTGEHHTH